MNGKLKQLQHLSNSDGEKLVGGFSNVISINLESATEATATNNCLGGNCAIGCSSGPVLGANTGCNAIRGCQKKT